MNLIDDIKAVQRHYGLSPDGIAGPLFVGAVLADLRDRESIPRPPIPKETVIALGDGTIANLDARTVKNIGTLDVKARDLFVSFALRCKATAATYGCDYVMIEGDRTWEEQDALYAQGRTIKGKKVPGPKVTNAMGGQSNHNFRIAGDFGVFRGKVYLDDSDPELAAKVHKACSMHAKACGLEWGGSWKSIVDLPHYEVYTGLSMMAKRALFKKEGSVL